MERLKELRESKGLLQKDVAAFLGVDRTTYVKYENGSSEPGLESIVKLADFYDVTTDFILDRISVVSRYEKSSSINRTLYSEINRMSTDEKEDLLDYIQYLRTRKEKRNSNTYLAAYGGAIHTSNNEKTPNAAREVFQEERNSENQ